jgi:signal transduction histidine kinase
MQSRSAASSSSAESLQPQPGSAAQPGYRLLALTEEELQRLVLDVHDGPVQYLFAALSQLTALRTRLAADGAPSAHTMLLQRAVECVEAALVDIRRTVSSFHAPAVAERGLAGVVERHAGVKDAAVRLWATNDCVYAEITDGGRGFDPPPLVGPDATELPAHIGLRGMRERVALVHGALSVESRPGGGTRVIAEVPTGG